MNPRRRIRAASDDPVEEMVENLTDRVDAILAKIDKREHGSGDGGGVYVPKWLVVMLVGFMLSGAGAGFWAGISFGQDIDYIMRTRDAWGKGLTAEMREFHRTNPPAVERTLNDHERRLNALGG